MPAQCRHVNAVGPAPWASALPATSFTSRSRVPAFALFDDGDFAVIGELPPTSIARLSPTGETRWSRPLPFPSASVATAGDLVVIAATLEQPWDSGVGLLTPAGNADAVVAAFSGDGQPRWATASSGEGGDEGSLVSVACDGTVYVSGNSASTVAFSAPPVPSEGAFLASFRKDGAHRWTRAVSRTKGAISALDASVPGEILVVGAFEGIVDLGGTTLTSAFSPVAGRDGFIAKLDTDGRALWARQISGVDDDIVSSAARGPMGDVYAVAGVVSHDAVVAGVSLEGGGDAYSTTILRFDSQGALLATRPIGKPYNVGQIAAAADRVVVAVTFRGVLNLAGRNFIARGPGDTTDTLLVTMNAALEVQSANAYGGEGNDDITFVALDSKGRTVVSGSFTQEITLGPGAVLTRSGGAEATSAPFLARLP